MKDLNRTIKLCIRGDEKAQRELYLAYRTRWYMMAMRYGKNKQQADDIFQEGLIQIFNSLHLFDERKGNFSTWSTRILIYAALKFLKKYNWVDSFKSIDEVFNCEDNQVKWFKKTGHIFKIVTNFRITFQHFFRKSPQKEGAFLKNHTY